VKTLIAPLTTTRLRIEPITAEISKSAEGGAASLSAALGAAAPREWWAANLRLLTARTRVPERAIVIHRDLERVIGDLRFEPVRGALRTYELGYSIMPEHRRQGVASEAAGAVLDWLFAEGGAERVIAGCDRRNRASVRTLRKLGFWLDGARGDAFWWTLSPEQRREAAERAPR
jgi:RimJ/RimL family protein N-acetyltransferase